MFPKIIGILKSSREPVSLNGINNALLDLHPQLTSKSQDLEQDVLKHLENGRKFGLIFGSEKGFKLSVDLEKSEDELFQSKLQFAQKELEALSAGTPNEQVEEPMEGPSNRIRSSRTPTLDRLMQQVDCGPGWNQRSPAQRRAIAIRQRMAAQEKARAMMKRGRSRSRSRSGSRQRSRARSGSRQRSRARSGSRQRSRARSGSRTRSQSRSRSSRSRR